MNRYELITCLQDCAEDESLPDNVQAVCEEAANHLLRYWPTEKGRAASKVGREGA